MTLKATINGFNAGVLADLAPEVVPNNAMASAHNIKITSNDNNQLILQKADGSEELLNGYPETLKPLAVKEYNDIVYFCSYNKYNNTTEYGSLPSPDNANIFVPVPGYVESSTDTVSPVHIDVNSDSALEIKRDPFETTVYEVGNRSSYYVRVRLQLPANLVNDIGEDHGKPFWMSPNSSVRIRFRAWFNTKLDESQPQKVYVIANSVYTYNLHGYKVYTNFDDVVLSSVAFSSRFIPDSTTRVSNHNASNIPTETFTYMHEYGPSSAKVLFTDSAWAGRSMIVKMTDQYDDLIDTVEIPYITGGDVFEKIYDSGTLEIEVNTSGTTSVSYRIVTMPSDAAFASITTGDTVATASSSAPPDYPISEYVVDTNEALFAGITWLHGLTLDEGKYLEFGLPVWPAVPQIVIEVSQGYSILEGPVIPNGAAFHLAGSSATTTNKDVDFLFKVARGYSIGDVVPANMYTIGNKVVANNSYGPLLNYRDEEQIAESSYFYLDPFRVGSSQYSNALDYNEYTDVSMELQTTYDGSVNIITAAEGTVPRIVNSRMKAADNDKIELIFRDSGNLDNVYTDATIDKTRLIPYLGDTVIGVKFNGVTANAGILRFGGYKYYFKLKTSDGAESEIIEESRLVSVHDGEELGSSYSSVDSGTSSKAVSFTLSGINNKSYRYCSVYYTVTSGSTTTPVTSAYRVDNDYEINTEKGTCEIFHSGYEGSDQVDVSELVISYSPISSAKTVSQKNGRLMLGNTMVTETSSDVLKEAALHCFVSSTDFTDFNISQNTGGDILVESTYADPNNIYYNLGYMPGETYELGINFVFNTGFVSPTFAIQGLDFTLGSIYDTSIFGGDIQWNPDTGQNSNGVVRTVDISIEDNLISPVNPYPSVEASENQFKVRTMKVSTSALVTEYSALLKDVGVVSYFISRKERVPDLIMEGMVGLAAAVPSMTTTSRETGTYTLGNKLGVGPGSDGVGSKYNLLPAVGNMMPFSTEGIEDLNRGLDTVSFAPLADTSKNNYITFFSPDLVCDGARAASVFNGTNSYSIGTGDASYKQRLSFDFELNLNNGTASGSSVISPKEQIPYAAHSKLYRYSTPEVRSTDARMNYVADGIRSFASRSFTGRSDRQLYLFLEQRLRAEFTDSAKAPNIKNLQDQMIAIVTSQITRDHIYSFDNGLDWQDHGATDGSEDYLHVMASNVAYSPYLGIELDVAAAKRIIEHLDLDTQLISTSSYFASIFNKFSYPAPPPEQYPDDHFLGMSGRIYSNSAGEPMSAEQWRSKYQNGGAGDRYFPITERFRVTEEIPTDYKLSGGDCYVGFHYQRLWRPGGVAGVPTASSPIDYVEDRSGSGITSSGMAICFPARSSYNFAIRAKEAVDVEKELYGNDRTYTSRKTVTTVRGNQQPETSVINYGNIIESSVVPRIKFDNTAPYNNIEQSNRVYVSDVDIQSEFENGYRDFRGFNFRDYDTDLGSITAIVSQGIYTYIVYKSGVSIIEVLERSAIQSETGNNVYIANAAVLPEKSTNILSFIGSKHSKSVISTEAGIFGIDSDRKKIWTLNGNQPEVISDGRVQSVINPWFSDNLRNIFSSYNQANSEVTFVFENNDGSTNAIVYNSMLKVWYGTSDTDPIYQFMMKDKEGSIRAVNDAYRVFTPEKTIPVSIKLSDEENIGIYDSHFEFIIKDLEVNGKFQLNNLIVNGMTVPTSIDITPSDSKLAATIAESLDGNLPCFTNIFMVDGPVTKLSNSFYFNISGLSGTYAPGDLITVVSNAGAKQRIVVKVEGDVLMVNKETYIDSRDSITIAKGWKVPARLSLMEQDTDQLRISIPTKVHSDRLRGLPIDKTKAMLDKSMARPGGRYVRVRFNYDGCEPMQINTIISSISLTYS